MAAKRIGIVAVSAEGAALCYRTICAESAAALGAHDHLPITMHTTPLAKYMRPVEAGRWDEAVQGVIRDLGARGCDAVVLGCTEIPLLITDTDSPLPALDSTRILARAAIREET